jgi:dTDP-glucose 4,6-dehydratase
MRRLLITGGAGFIGSNLVRYWLAAQPHDRISVVDKFSEAGSPENLSGIACDGRLDVIAGDIRDTDAIARVIHDSSIDVVIHLAAETHVDRSIAEPLDFVQHNVVGTASLLEAVRLAKSSGGAGIRFHQVSTDEVFGSLTSDAGSTDERAAYRPRSPYAATKAGSDHLVRAYMATYGLQATISYSSNNYGPFQHPEKLLPRTIWSALSGRPIQIYGNGQNVRDWLFVHDHCRALDRILLLGKVGRAYNVSASQPRANLDLVRDLCRRIDARIQQSSELRVRYPNCPAARGGICEELITMVADRPGHDWRYAVDATLLARDTGFAAACLLDNGLERTLNWYLSRSDWLERRAGGHRC